MLVEFAASVALIVTLVLGGAGMLRAQWQRARCAYLVFEFAHAARIGARPSLREPSGLRTVREAEWIETRARCGSGEEVVRLPLWRETS